MIMPSPVEIMPRSRRHEQVGEKESVRYLAASFIRGRKPFKDFSHCFFMTADILILTEHLPGREDRIEGVESKALV